jgi:hypothetical protein
LPDLALLDFLSRGETRERQHREKAGGEERETGIDPTDVRSFVFHGGLRVRHQHDILKTVRGTPARKRGIPGVFMEF